MGQKLKLVPSVSPDGSRGSDRIEPHLQGMAKATDSILETGSAYRWSEAARAVADPDRNGRFGQSSRAKRARSMNGQVLTSTSFPEPERRHARGPRGPFDGAHFPAEGFRRADTPVTKDHHVAAGDLGMRSCKDGSVLASLTDRIDQFVEAPRRLSPSRSLTKEGSTMAGSISTTVSPSRRLLAREAILVD